MFVVCINWEGYVADPRSRIGAAHLSLVAYAEHDKSVTGVYDSKKGRWVIAMRATITCTVSSCICSLSSKLCERGLRLHRVKPIGLAFRNLVDLTLSKH